MCLYAALCLCYTPAVRLCFPLHFFLCLAFVFLVRSGAFKPTAHEGHCSVAGFRTVLFYIFCFGLAYMCVWPDLYSCAWCFVRYVLTLRSSYSRANISSGVYQQEPLQGCRAGYRKPFGAGRSRPFVALSAVDSRLLYVGSFDSRVVSRFLHLLFFPCVRLLH